MAILGIADVITTGVVNRGDCLSSAFTDGQARSDGSCQDVATFGSFGVALTASAGGVSSVKALITGVERN